MERTPSQMGVRPSFFSAIVAHSRSITCRTVRALGVAALRVMTLEWAQANSRGGPGSATGHATSEIVALVAEWEVTLDRCASTTLAREAAAVTWSQRTAAGT